MITDADVQLFKTLLNKWGRKNPTKGVALLSGTSSYPYWRFTEINNYDNVICKGEEGTYQSAYKAWEEWGHENFIDAPIAEIKKRSKIIQEIEKVLDERQENYAPPTVNFKHIASVWSDLLGAKVTPQDVALMMIELKVIREKHAHTFDNLLDIVGYVLCLEEIEDDV